MKLIVNTASTYKGGGVQVARSFIEECQKFDEFEYYVILGSMLSNLIDETQFPSNFHFYRIGYRPATKVISFVAHDQFFKKLESQVKPDVVFTTSGPAYWRPTVPHVVGYNLPHYIYKDSPFFSQISVYKRMKWNLKGRVIKYFLKREADAFVVQTNDVNNRLSKWIQTEKIFTVSNTFGSQYINSQQIQSGLPDRGKSEFRLLTLSAWYPHKNIDIIIRVIDAFDDRLKNDVRFVLTLPAERYKQTFPESYRKFIYNTGPIKPEHGPSLYKECDALFMPTLLECFSASYAEAMIMEKPIITSDLSFAKSICQDAALFADPLDPEEIANKIAELIQDVNLKKSLIEKGKKQVNRFPNAEDRAREYLNICKAVANACQ